MKTYSERFHLFHTNINPQHCKDEFILNSECQKTREGRVCTTQNASDLHGLLRQSCSEGTCCFPCRRWFPRRCCQRLSFVASTAVAAITLTDFSTSPRISRSQLSMSMTLSCTEPVAGVSVPKEKPLRENASKWRNLVMSL